MPDIKNMAIDELENLFLSMGEDKYRAEQAALWIYRGLAPSFNHMTNLPVKLREKLDELCWISALSPIKEQKSRDGTRKYLFKLQDGNLIEGVLIPETDHLTICISTQVGCALGCKFCLTGKGGFIRNLKTSEIINQICYVKGSLSEKEKLSNIVLMGMGEPLANYDNTLKALRIITHPKGLGFSTRKVTVSTAGLIPAIQRLGQDSKVNLAVSLNATENHTRDYLMPINKTYPLDMLLNACHEFPLPARKRITFEYILIKGINDSPNDAIRLTKLLKGIRCKINLIPFNEHHASSFKTPDNDVLSRFQEILIEANLTSTIRSARGLDILAACGQLGNSR